MLSLLLQAAQQSVPPITVVVQQPASGSPEWVKILVTAAVGAFVGIISNSIMEVVKPRIARAVSKKEITDQLIEELKSNVGALQYLKEFPDGGILDLKLDDEAAQTAQKLNWAGAVVYSIRATRYEVHLQTNKLLVYQIDAGGYLEMFYMRAKTSLPKLLEDAKENPTPEAITLFYSIVDEAITTGEFFLKTRPGNILVSDLRRRPR